MMGKQHGVLDDDDGLALAGVSVGLELLESGVGRKKERKQGIGKVLHVHWKTGACGCFCVVLFSGSIAAYLIEGIE